MLKFTFNVSEEVIKNKIASLDEKESEIKDSRSALKSVFERITFGILDKKVQKGETSFEFDYDKLSDKAKDIGDEALKDLAFLTVMTTE